MGNVIEIIKKRTKNVLDYVRNIINQKKFKYISFFWLIISIQFVIGSNLQTKGYSVKDSREFFIDISKVIILSLIFITLHYLIMKLYIMVKKNIENNEKNKTELKKNRWAIYFFLILACWIPILLAFYPSIVSYDGGYQIKDYVFKNEINLGHPVITTILYTFFYLFGIYIFKSPNIGMFIFSVSQMIFIALIFSYAVKFIETETKKKWVRNVSIVFYAIFPYNQLFPIITTKDVIFSGFVILFIISIYKVFYKKCSMIDYIYTGIVGTLMLLFRSNAKYALFMIIPFLIIVFKKNIQKIKKLLVTIILIVIVSQVIDDYFISLVNNENYNGFAIYCIFTQAIGKIANEKKDELTENEKNQISKYFGNYEKLGDKYRPNIADNTTNMLKVNIVNNNKVEFYKFAFELMTKYPSITIDSYLNTIRGYWYINDTSFATASNIIDSRISGALELYCLPIGKDEYMVYEDSKIPKLKQFYKDLFCKNEYQKIPILYILFQPATYFYMLIAYLLYNLYRKNKIEFIIGMYLFLYFLTFFIGPCAIIRYIYPIITAIPILLGFIKKAD